MKPTSESKLFIASECFICSDAIDLKVELDKYESLKYYIKLNY